MTRPVFDPPSSRSDPRVCRNCVRTNGSYNGPPTVYTIMQVRELCSACKVHTADCFTQAAPWIDQRPVGQP